MTLPERKRIRLQNFDYSGNGMYFITLCTQNRKKVLSEIITVGDGFPVPKLTFLGRFIQGYIDKISEKYPSVKVVKYIIMPDHIHFLISIENDGTGNPSPTTNTVMAWFKYQTTKEINAKRKSEGEKFWQRAFFDHVIRNNQDFEEIWNYIDTNPHRWIEKISKKQITFRGE